MLTHTQRDVGPLYGSCVATSIACLLDLPQEAVPNVCLYHRWQDALDLWCRQKGLIFHFRVDFGVDDDRTCRRDTRKEHEPFAACGEPLPTHGLVICGGQSPRATPEVPMTHAVIWDIAAGRCMWDPHPSRAGLASPPRQWYWFTSAPPI